jgi:hypothetical protein
MFECNKIAKVLQSCGMIKASDNKIIKQLWTAIGCEEHKGISLASLKNVIFAIMKLPSDSIPLITEHSFSFRTSIGQYIDSTLCFDAEESIKLHTEFKSLFFNRIAIRRGKAVVDAFDYCPKLCDRSTELAKRSKTQRSSRNTYNLLNEVTKANLEKLKECTFKPKINENRRSKSKEQM